MLTQSNNHGGCCFILQRIKLCDHSYSTGHYQIDRIFTKYFKTLRCGCGAFVFIFASCLKLVLYVCHTSWTGLKCDVFCKKMPSFKLAACIYMYKE